MVDPRGREGKELCALLKKLTIHSSGSSTGSEATSAAVCNFPSFVIEMSLGNLPFLKKSMS